MNVALISVSSASLKKEKENEEKPAGPSRLIEEIKAAAKGSDEEIPMLSLPPLVLSLLEVKGTVSILVRHVNDNLK